MLRTRPLLSTLAMTTLAASPALALGALVTPAGSSAKIERTRSLVVRHPDSVEWIVQIKWSGDAQRAGWLIPVPDFVPDPNSGASPVSVRPFPSAALDELEARTAPQFSGVCEDTPTAEQGTAGFGESWREGNPSVSARIIAAGEILQGALDSYLMGAGREYEVPTAVDESVAALVDQNFMFLVVNLDAAAATQDPIISIRWPAEPNDNVKLGTRALKDSLAGDRAPVLFWTLAAARQSANLPTTPVALDSIDFVSNVETNYEIALERHVDQRQSQAFALEAAAAAPAFEHPELQAFADGGGAGYLTRLRGSLLPAALQNNVATVTLRPAVDTADYANAQAIEGRACGALTPDVGPTPTEDASVPTSDAEQPSGDAAPPAGDSGFGANTDAGAASGGGGGGGGCAISPRAPASGVLLVLGACVAAARARRRRS